MSFTNIDLVKKHIREQERGSANKKDAACQLTGENYYQLPHLMLQVGSEKVKAKEQNIPVQETVSFASSDSMLLSHQELIPDTVVVANDSSLGEIYAENVDYTIDYEKGKITRVSNGAISPAVAVVIWYFYYRVYVKDTDYQIDYSKGQIRRRSSGEIEDGQWVLVTYSAEYSLLSDEVMENAIKEANDQILQYIDSAYTNSTDQALVTAETHLAVSILANIKAMEAINQPVGAGSSGQVHSLSLAWAKMSVVYRDLAYEMLKQFRKDPGGFCSPHAVRSIR
jgi:hypothetical protein